MAHIHTHSFNVSIIIYSIFAFSFSFHRRTFEHLAEASATFDALSEDNLGVAGIESMAYIHTLYVKAGHEPDEVEHRFIAEEI